MVQSPQDYCLRRPCLDHKQVWIALDLCLESGDHLRLWLPRVQSVCSVNITLEKWGEMQQLNFEYLKTLQAT